jgi:hypothetical protein
MEVSVGVLAEYENTSFTVVDDSTFGPGWFTWSCAHVYTLNVSVAPSRS